MSTVLLLEDGSIFAFEDGSYWELETAVYGSAFGQHSTIPVDRWDQQIRAPHQAVTLVQILRDGEVIIDDLAVTSGEVTFDRRAEMYGQATIELAEPTLVGFTVNDPLTPFGNEFRVWSGVQYGDRSIELEPLVTCPITRAETDGIALLTSLEGFDRSQRVKWARLEDDYEIAADTNYAEAIRALIDAGVPGLTYRFASTAFTTPALVVPRQADRWQTAVDMARKIGMVLYFDGLGELVLEPETDPRALDPVDSFHEGERGVLVGISVELDRESTYNVVCVESSNADQTEVYEATAEDDDPASPTYVGGPYGRQPRFYASPLIASTDQATAAARSILEANLGVPCSLNLSAVANPRRRPGDVISVRREALGIDAVYVLDTVTIGLGATGSMTCTARTRWETDLTVA